jgi:hypothetical protein
LVLTRVEGGVAVASARATSGSDGAFAIDTNNGPGVWSLDVSGAGGAACRIREIHGDVARVEIGAIELLPPVALRGRITNETGEPIAGARVVARPSLDPDAPWLSAASGTDGNYTISNIPPGRIDVGASATGFADAVRPGAVVNARRGEVNFVLRRGSSFGGRVVDDSGAPVGGASVRIRRRDALAAAWREPVSTDADGRFAQPGFAGSARDFECLVSKVGFLLARVDANEIALGRPARLVRGKLAIVRVDPPAPPARIEVESMTRVGQGFRRDAAAVEAKDWEELGNGRYRVTAPAGEFLRAFVTLRGGALAASPHVELAKATDPPELVATSTPAASQPASGGASKPAPEKTSRLVGKLTYGVAPPGEEVPIAAYRAVADSDGRGRKIESLGMVLAAADGSFAFDALPPGRIALVPKRPAPPSGGAVRSYADEFPPFRETGWQKIATVGADGAPVAFDLAVPRPQERAVSGAVFIDGKPARNCVVELIPTNGTAGAGSDATDEAGRYTIPILRPGEFDLRVRASQLSETRRIVVTDGQSRRVNFDLASGAIAGRIADADDKPLEVRVLLQRERDSARDVLWRSVPIERATAADGSFTIPVGGGGRYRILVHDPRHIHATVASEPFEAAAGSQQSLPTIRIPKEVPLRVSARDAKGGPGTGRVWVTALDGTPRLAHLAQGWLFAQKDFLTIHGLPPGSYRVRMPGYLDEIARLATGAPASVSFARPRPEVESSPSADSAYHSPEAEEDKHWDWAGEVPALFDQEDPPS